VRRRSAETEADRKLLLDLARMVMRVDAKLDVVLRALGEEHGEEEMDT
jgi:hypothetical protein